jgi:ABC-type oligopeptide transport system substrate-binding subunit
MKSALWLFPLSLTLAGCSGDEHKPVAPVLDMLVISEPPGRLQPDRDDWNAASAIVTQATTAGLVSLDSDGEVIPALAQSWRVSDDGSSYIFRLADVQWSDGRAVVGRDFVTLFRNILKPGSRHPFKPYLQGLENAADVASGRKPVTALGVSSPMSDIVELRLSSVRPALLQMLGRAEMTLPARDGGRITVGPYRVTRTESSITMLTLHDDNAAAKKAVSGGVKLIAEPDVEAAIERFRADRLPLLTGGGTGDYHAVRAAGLERLAQFDPVAGIYGYRVDRMGGVIEDVRLRRALAMAIDRQAIIQATGIDGAAAIVGAAPTGLSALPVPAVPDWQALDMTARTNLARQLVAEVRAAQADPEQPVRVTVAVPARPGDRRIMGLVATAWQAIGVETDVVDADEPADLALYERVAPADLPTWFLRPFSCQRLSYCNKAFDDALSDARFALSQIGREAAIAHADRLLVDDAALIPVMTAARWTLLAQGTSGWTPSRWGVHPLTLVRSPAAR